MEFSGGPPLSRAWMLLFGLPVIAAAFGAYVLAAPTSLRYNIDATALTIDAKLGILDQGKVIPRSAIQGVEAARATSAHRTAGTGMDGYCQGSWTLGGIGAAWIATDCRPDVVVVHTTTGTVVVSPGNRAAFIAAIEDAAGNGTFPLPAAPHPTWMYALAALILILPVGTLFFVMKIFQPLSYRIEGGALVVPRHFGVLRVPLAGARVTPGGLRGAIRLAGSGLPGFHLGLYRDGAGSFHACGTARDGGLMVTGERRIYVTPTDHAGFLAAARAAGAEG